MRGLGRLKRWAERMATRPLSRSMILIYHRIISLQNDPQRLCVSPENFDMHLNIIRRHFHPISLQQLSSDLRNGRITNRSIVITFDDGYEDNLYQAKPILEKHGIPATVFAVSDWIGSQREFFWDDLARILLTTTELPDRLKIKIDGKTYEWDFTDQKKEQPFMGLCLPSGLWNVEMSYNPTPRHIAYRELAPLLRDADTNERERVLMELTDWAGITSDSRVDHRTLTAEELRVLEDGGLIDVGAHTKTHVRLSKLSADAQKHEIFDSKKHLDALLGHPVKNFSYPFGDRTDYNATSIELSRAAGFTCACSNFQGFVHRWSDPFQFPRFLVRNWDGEEFERHLAEWSQ